MDASHDRHQARDAAVPIVRGNLAPSRRVLGLGSLFLLTVMLVVWLVAGPSGPRQQLLGGVGLGALIVGVAWTIGREERRSARSLLAVAALCAVALVLLATVSVELARTGAMLVLLLVGFVAPMSIIAGLRRHRRLDMSLLLGATTIYLLVGVAFAMAYSMVATIEEHGILLAEGERTDATLSDRVYFSYVTLSTTGYGDYTPKNGAVRALAILEALGGQLYLVIAMTSVVTTLLQHRRSH